MLSNHVEGFHNKFSSLVGHGNQTVWLDAVTVRGNQNLFFNALARHGGNPNAPLSNDTVIIKPRQLKGVLRQFGTTSSILF